MGEHPPATYAERCKRTCGPAEAQRVAGEGEARGGVKQRFVSSTVGSGFRRQPAATGPYRFLEGQSRSKKSDWRTMMRISIGILSLAALSVLAGCAKTQKAGPEPVPVVTEIVATQHVQPSWTYSGEIRPDTEVQLAFKEPGYSATLYRVKGVDGRMRDVQVGDEIPAGATLARLRSSDYEASLNSAVGQQRSAQGTLDASQAELNRAKADQTKADLDFERAQALYAAKAMTRPDYDAAVEQHASATANVEAAVRQIEARRGQVAAAQAQTVSARISLGDTNLIAPMPGVVVGKNVEPGSLVNAGTNAFTLDDTRVVKVNFGVPDSMLGHLKLGAAVPVQVEALQ